MPAPRLLIALVTSLAIAAGTFGLPSHPLDVTVTRWLQRAAPAPDRPAALFVFLGDAEVLIPAAAAAGLLLWPRDRTAAGSAWALAVGLLATSTMAFLMKQIVPHPGPPPEFQRHVVRPGIGFPEPYSFPSGHTMRTVYLTVDLLRRAPALGGTLVAAMMTALVYLGDHWTTDVMGGLCLGWACAEAGRLLMRVRLRSRLRG
jgi:membrane-associated phospholipid phosphatase